MTTERERVLTEFVAARLLSRKDGESSPSLLMDGRVSMGKPGVPMGGDEINISFKQHTTDDDLRKQLRNLLSSGKAKASLIEEHENGQALHVQVDHRSESGINRLIDALQSGRGVKIQVRGNRSDIVRRSIATAGDGVVSCGNRRIDMAQERNRLDDLVRGLHSQQDRVTSLDPNRASSIASEERHEAACGLRHVAAEIFASPSVDSHNQMCHDFLHAALAGFGVLEPQSDLSCPSIRMQRRAGRVHDEAAHLLDANAQQGGPHAKRIESFLATVRSTLVVGGKGPESDNRIAESAVTNADTAVGFIRLMGDDMETLSPRLQTFVRHVANGCNLFQPDGSPAPAIVDAPLTDTGWYKSDDRLTALANRALVSPEPLVDQTRAGRWMYRPPSDSATMTYHLTQESSEIGLTVEPSSTAQIGLGKEKAAPRDQDTATDDRIVLPPPPGRIPAIVYADGSSPAPMSLPKLQGSVDAAAMRDFLTDRVLLDEDQCNRILEVMKSSETNVDLTASIPHVVNRALAADPTTDEARQSRATLQNAMRSGRVHPSEIADHVLTMVEDQPDLAVISGSAGPRSSGALQFVTTSSQGLTWRDIRMSTSDQERAIVATWADDHARGGLVAKGIIGGEETDRDSDLDTLRLLMGRPLTLEGRDSYMAIRSAQATPELQPIAVANYVSLQADALRQVDEGPVS